MEYIGKEHRKIDDKRRLVLPLKWKDDNTSFVLVQEETAWMLYPQEFWKQKMLDLKKDTEKVALAENSYQRKIDANGRILLPKEFTWRIIQLTGVISYISIKESTG